MRQNMQKSIDVLRSALLGIHHGNVSPALVGTVKISCYNQISLLDHLASIVGSGTRICVSIYDPAIIKSVESALQKSGFNAAIFSKKEIIVTVPQYSGEQRDKTIARIMSLGEDAKISVRNIRKHARSKMSEQDRKEQDKNIQLATDNFVEEIEDIIRLTIEKIKH